MNAHQLDADGVIINTIVVEALDALPNLVDASIGGSIGDRIVNGAVVPKPIVVSVPDSVPMLDARLTLIASGKMAAVRAHLNAMTGVEGEQAREYFEFALTMKRHHPLVVGIPASVMTEAEKDALFIQAGALNA